MCRIICFRHVVIGNEDSESCCRAPSSRNSHHSCCIRCCTYIFKRLIFCGLIIFFVFVILILLAEIVFRDDRNRTTTTTQPKVKAYAITDFGTMEAFLFAPRSTKKESEDDKWSPTTRAASHPPKATEKRATAGTTYLLPPDDVFTSNTIPEVMVPQEGINWEVYNFIIPKIEVTSREEIEEFSPQTVVPSDLLELLRDF